MHNKLQNSIGVTKLAGRSRSDTFSPVANRSPFTVLHGCQKTHSIAVRQLRLLPSTSSPPSLSHGHRNGCLVRLVVYASFHRNRTSFSNRDQSTMENVGRNGSSWSNYSSPISLQSLA
ncbi:hypothetical protein SESBI_16088 [Sesbania bispinosa]|nr:hypothetical protein SESBI_16088 [Sesbania bispinosa]